MAGPEARKRGAPAIWHRKTYEIVAKLEAEAFYDGYYLALAFACGSLTTSSIVNTGLAGMSLSDRAAINSFIVRFLTHS
jgi:predicted metal-binding protein